jgi:hypothetical protein
MRKFIIAAALVSFTAVPVLAGVSTKPTNPGNQRTPSTSGFPTQSQSPNPPPPAPPPTPKW